MRICLSLGLKTIEDVHRHWQRWASQVEATEVRLDTLAKPDLAALLGKKPGPVIITNRRREEGGYYEGSEEERVDLLLEAIERGADYVDLEAKTPPPYLGKALSRIKEKKARVILSWHDLRGTPTLVELKRRFREMSALKPDVIKIVTFARRYEDNLSILNLIPYARKHGKEIISFCMGPFGKPSRVLAGFLGSYFTYVAPETGSETAPGQLTVKEILEIRRLIE